MIQYLKCRSGICAGGVIPAAVEVATVLIGTRGF
jgi:hypothetical protein